MMCRSLVLSKVNDRIDVLCLFDVFFRRFILPLAILLYEKQCSKHGWKKRLLGGPAPERDVVIDF
jgi:hypothetical protein